MINLPSKSSLNPCLMSQSICPEFHLRPGLILVSCRSGKSSEASKKKEPPQSCITLQRPCKDSCTNIVAAGNQKAGG